MGDGGSPPASGRPSHGAVGIAYVIGSLGKGGAEYQLHELVRRLDPARFVPCVIALSEGGHWAEAIRARGIRVLEVPQHRRIEPGRLLRLRGLLAELRPTVLHTILWSGNSYGRLAAIGLGIPIVVASERNVIRRPAWQRWLERGLDAVTTAYLVNARAVADELTAGGGLPAGKMHVVHNGIDLAALPPFAIERHEARRRLGLEPARRLVAQVGRLEPQKDHATFLRAMTEVVARHPDVDVVVVGEGRERARIEAAVTGAGLGGRVRLLGLRHDVPAILAGTDVLVLSSRWEGLPNVVIEAMATGAATVATDVGGCATLLRDGAGRVVPVGDAAAIAREVSTLLADEEARVATVRRARARVEAELTVERMALETTAVYEALLAETAA